MGSNRVSEVGARDVPAVQRDNRARRRCRDQDEGEVEGVCTALATALVEAAETAGSQIRPHAAQPSSVKRACREGSGRGSG
jgi:hypothetical protein